MKRAILIVLSVLIFASTANASAIVYNGLITSTITDSGGNPTSISVDTPSLGYYPLTQQPIPSAFTTGSTSYYADGFEYDWDLWQGSVAGSDRQIATVVFTVDVDSDYVLDGYVYSVDSDGNDVNFSVNFFEAISLDTIFYDTQTSHGLPNESFTLGSLGQIGSMTGVLQGGLSYILVIEVENVVDGTGFMPIHTYADFTLDFVAVPEPSTALLVAIGLVALSISRRIKE